MAHIDHIITFANVSAIDAYVGEYRSRGFIVSEATHRYKPGLRNRFVTLGCEYIELAWVEEEGVGLWPCALDRLPIVGSS
jgi:hypothetical protein